MDWSRWLAAFAVLALLPLAGCVAEDDGGDESTADGNDDDVRVEGDDDLRIDCSGDTEDHGEEESGYLQCDLDDGNTE